MKWIKQYVEDDLFIDVPESECIFDDVSDDIDMCELDILYENMDAILATEISSDWRDIVKTDIDLLTMLFLSRLGFLDAE